MMPDLMKITENLSYLKATHEPLSADVGVVFGNEFTWIFDVGSSDEAKEMINALPGKKNIVLSHFHPDHISNLSSIAYDHLYVSAHTFKYTKCGELVKGHLTFNDGFPIHIFELPSSHAKGSLGMEVDDTYAFLGDGIYTQRKEGRAAYNANLLLEEIRLLKSLHAPYVLLSHDEVYIYERSKVIEELESIYLQRDKNNAYIFVD